MTATPPSDFFELSAILTGFRVRTLRLAQQDADFYGVFEKVYGSAQLGDLMAFYTARRQAGSAAQQIGEAILADGSPVAETARALMVFWYLGQIAPHDGSEDLHIPSANHYAQALAWRAVQAHPTGVSTLRFGYWATPPAPFDDYL
ncbi:hypothetical protein [Roseovarius nanhaiticus]|uniref:hypothetical protein n=1 Tax=Roseovarius nanhaiticus TaxID=573024 RepID=UPI0024927A57|nr:hypothetical protein [Roseovarius nanhaiticus]